MDYCCLKEQSKICYLDLLMFWGEMQYPQKMRMKLKEIDTNEINFSSLQINMYYQHITNRSSSRRTYL